MDATLDGDTHALCRRVPVQERKVIGKGVGEREVY